MALEESPSDGAPCSGPRRHPARRGEGDRLRGEIVAAALRLLGESGDLNALSLRAVAREVGVAATSIYLHFPDLEALLRDAKVELMNDLFTALQRAASEAGTDPADRLHAHGRAYLRFAAERPGHYRVMFQSRMVEAPYLPPGATYVGAEAFEAVRAAVAAVIGDDDALMVTLHFWTALHGMVMLRTDRRNFPWPDLEDELDDLIRRLVGR